MFLCISVTLFRVVFRTFLVVLTLFLSQNNILWPLHCCYLTDESHQNIQAQIWRNIQAWIWRDMKELWLLLCNLYTENSPKNDWNGLKKQKAIANWYQTFPIWNSEESDLHTNIQEQILISVTELLWSPHPSKSCTLSSWYLQVYLLHYVQILTEL